MPRIGYKSVTMKEEFYNKLKQVQQHLKKKSVSKTVESLIEDKHKEVNLDGL